jgi:hypothetical protein
VKILNHAKLKLLQDFNVSDLEPFYDTATSIVNETKRWIDVIESLSKENKRMTFELMMNKNYSKFAKTKAVKFNECDEPPKKKSWSVYSEGNVANERNMIDDFSPYEVHEELQLHPNPSPAPQSQLFNNAGNSLEILFK